MMMLNNILISNGGIITKWLQLVTKYPKYFHNKCSIISFWHDILLTYKARPNKNEGNKRGDCKISRCSSCGQFFDSKRELKGHIDKNHRITNSKIVIV